MSSAGGSRVWVERLPDFPSSSLRLVIVLLCEEQIQKVLFVSLNQGHHKAKLLAVTLLSCDHCHDLSVFTVTHSNIRRRGGFSEVWVTLWLMLVKLCIPGSKLICESLPDREKCYNHSYLLWRKKRRGLEQNF